MGGILLPYVGLTGQMGWAAPNTIPSLSLWYNGSGSNTSVNGVTKPNFDTNPISNGSSLSKWKDLMGVAGDSNTNGGTGKNPTYTTPIQNGLGAVTYSSANSNNLDINPTAWAQNLSGYTMFVLARPTSLPATAFPLTVSDTSLGMWWNGTNWSVGVTAGNSGTVSLTNDTTKFHVYCMIFDGSQTGNANRLQFKYDLAGKSLTYSGTIPATTGTPAYMYFGGDNRSGGAGGALSGTYMTGYIGEVMIWQRTLSTAEISAVELYLNQKWGLGL